MTLEEYYNLKREEEEDEYYYWDLNLLADLHCGHC